jgi:hypothetical protein
MKKANDRRGKPPSEPRRHHFVSRMHLKRFVGQAPAGHVWTYEETSGARRSAIPDETAVESHFYSVDMDNGEMDVRLEQMLGDVESDAEPIYQRLLDGRVPLPGSQERADFSTFLALMYAGLRR